MINKKLLLQDIIVFIFGFLLMLIYSLIFRNENTIFVRTVFTFLSIIVSVYSLYISYKNVCNKSFLYTIFPLICFCLFYVIYLLPCFGFIGHIGANNNICMIFEFMFGAKFVINISYFLNAKLACKKVIVKNRVLHNRYDYSKLFRYFGIICFCVGIAEAIINIFINKIDMSTPYQLIFLHKSLFDI